MNEVTNHLLQVIHARLEAEAFTKNVSARAHEQEHVLNINKI